MTQISATPKRLYLMQLGTSTIPTTPPSAGSAGCYLIQTTDGKNVLIDSGLPADYTPAPGAPPTKNKKNVLEHLVDIDLRPDDIDMLICTHFDVDHAGYHDAFPQAELIVQREHYELARSGHARFAAARAHWDHPALCYRLIDGDTELLPGMMLLKTSGTCARTSVSPGAPTTDWPGAAGNRRCRPAAPLHPGSQGMAV